jgi:hypothetical protein
MEPIALENIEGAVATAARLLGDGVVRTSTVEHLLDAILCELCSTLTNELTVERAARNDEGAPQINGAAAPRPRRRRRLHGAAPGGWALEDKRLTAPRPGPARQILSG